AFSNVGVEAALCERDTILCQFSGMETPIRLDEMGLGFPTKSPKELAKAIADTLAGGATREEIRRNRSVFFQRNEHFIERIAADGIFSLRKDIERIGRGRLRPLVLED
ncbi:MAG: hypothetical protein AAGJ50_15990, partial [Pseudomonadota bacterium]